MLANFFYKLKSSLCFFILSFCLISFSISSFADPIFRVNNGANQVISKFGICENVLNASGKDIMVPANTSGEWSAFLAHLPSGVTINSTGCCTPGSQEFSTAGANTFVVPTNCTSLMIEIWGGGGGSYSNVSLPTETGGGGAGGYSSETITVTSAQNVGYTVGAKGISSGTAARNGGATTCDVMTANGGQASTTSAAGVGGSASGGTTNITGANGTATTPGVKGGNGADGHNFAGTGGAGAVDSPFAAATPGSSHGAGGGGPGCNGGPPCGGGSTGATGTVKFTYN